MIRYCFTPEYLKDPGTNALVVGSSGSGKTRSYVRSVINQSVENEGSFVAVSINDRYYTEMLPELTQKGYTVKHIYADEYNPFENIKTPYDVTSMADVMLNMDPNSLSDDKTQNLAERSLLIALIFYVHKLYADKPEKHNFVTVREIVNYGRGNENYITSLFDEFVKAYPANPLEKYYDLFKQSETFIEKENASLDTEDKPESTICRLAHKLANFYFTALLENKNPDFNDLLTPKTAVFIQLMTRDPYFVVRSSNSFVQTMLITQMLSFMSNHPDDMPPVNVILDDFQYLGRIPDFYKMTAAEAYDISVDMIVQSICQITSVYGEDVLNAIIANCDSVISYGAADYKTIEFFDNYCKRPDTETNAFGKKEILVITGKPRKRNKPVIKSEKEVDEAHGEEPEKEN